MKFNRIANAYNCYFKLRVDLGKNSTEKRSEQLSIWE